MQPMVLLRHKRRNLSSFLPRVVSGWFRSETDFHPILSYFFTDWRCNISCGYCYTYDNSRRGMSWETASGAIDWLRSIGCRVLAIMGGEPLLRRDFILKVITKAAKADLFVYLPTNGVLLTEDFAKEAGSAGLSALNIAVDCMEAKAGLPKAFQSIRKQFAHALSARREFGFLVFFNINITRHNIADVKKLTEIAYEADIAVDYHIVEPPMVEQHHWRGRYSDFCVRADQLSEVRELAQWIHEKKKVGLRIVNEPRHLGQLADFAAGDPRIWKCRAGHRSMVIRMDGSLAPCFQMYSADTDWGTVGNPRFEVEQLQFMKRTCAKRCFSTCNFNLAELCHVGKALRWAWRNLVFSRRGRPIA